MMVAKKHTKESILTAYMNYVLTHDKIPTSVYKFCEEIKIKEIDFYKFYGSIEAIKKQVWAEFFNNTKKLIEKNKEYEQYSNRNKMLTFFFTFFELLTLNRSYVLYTIGTNKNILKNLEEIKDLRRLIKTFASALIEDKNAEKSLKVTQHSSKIFSEGAWLQFLFLLKFWMDDSSAGFEKTDIAIEKSVNTIFDVFNTAPLENIIDFGKFLYKEKFA